MKVAITGAGGRLGRALVAALEEAPFAGPRGPIAWRRPDYDLDDPGAAARVLDRDGPEVVVHAAAWTDVDGCARDPERAMRRNATAVAELAGGCASRRIDLVLVSTNEVFDGVRTDVLGYRADDPPHPANAYGASKLAGERAARDAFAAAGGLVDRPDGHVGGLGEPIAAPQLAIVRTSWLFGPPGADFPTKILAAAARARADGTAVRVVVDEIGSPTYAPDLADAIVELIGSGRLAGIHHVVGGGVASRAIWAREVLRVAGLDVPLEPVPAAAWERLSPPPRWAVLEPTPLPGGEPLRDWRLALADYAPTLLREAASDR